MKSSLLTNVRRSFIWLTTAALFCSGLFSSALRAQQPKTEETMSRQFWADAKVYSARPGDELATFRSQPSGGVGPSGTLTLGISLNQRHFEVRMVASLKEHRFLTKVTVKPTEGDSGTKPQEIDYDLSDLNPRLLEIARDDDGRVYRLSLIPSIREKPLPMQFKPTDLVLEYWSFPSSPIILNDQDYLGRFSMGRSPLAWCDIPGVAKVEFSLMHLKDALPIGTLENGVINIAHENGTTLRISDVKNGRNQDVLGGGPYRVWVRWKKPSQSIEEYRESLNRQIAKLRERIKNGDLSVRTGTLERLEKLSESGRIGMIDMGITGVDPEELAEPAK